LSKFTDISNKIIST